MRVTLFAFCPQDVPPFELWAPREMRRVEAPESLGALVAEEEPGFAPNLVIGHDRVGAEATLPALTARLDEQAAALPGAELHAGQTLDGFAGEVAIVAFTHDGPPQGPRLHQMTACLLAPPRRSEGRHSVPEERDLIYLTGTCTVDQAPVWDPAFAGAAASLRFE